MDLKDTIIKQLAAPVKRKGTQDYMTDEEGNIVTSEAAIGMTIVQKALSGDLQAVAFVLNLQMQQQRDPKTEAEDADRRRRQEGDGDVCRHRGNGKALYIGRLQRLV